MKKKIYYKCPKCNILLTPKKRTEAKEYTYCRSVFCDAHILDFEKVKVVIYEL